MQTTIAKQWANLIAVFCYGKFFVTKNFILA